MRAHGDLLVTELRRNHPRFWRRLAPPRPPPAAPLGELRSYFDALLHLPGVDPTPPELPHEPLAPPVSTEELADILEGRYRGSASSGLSSLPS